MTQKEIKESLEIIGENYLSQAENNNENLKYSLLEADDEDNEDEEEDNSASTPIVNDPSKYMSIYTEEELREMEEEDANSREDEYEDDDVDYDDYDEYYDDEN